MDHNFVSRMYGLQFILIFKFIHQIHTNTFHFIAHTAHHRSAATLPLLHREYSNIRATVAPCQWFEILHGKPDRRTIIRHQQCYLPPQHPVGYFRPMHYPKSAPSGRELQNFRQTLPLLHMQYRPHSSGESPWPVRHLRHDLLVQHRAVYRHYPVHRIPCWADMARGRSSKPIWLLKQPLKSIILSIKQHDQRLAYPFPVTVQSIVRTPRIMFRY